MVNVGRYFRQCQQSIPDRMAAFRTGLADGDGGEAGSDAVRRRDADSQARRGARCAWRAGQADT